jgi:hypothetical protein
MFNLIDQWATAEDQEYYGAGGRQRWIDHRNGEGENSTHEEKNVNRFIYGRAFARWCPEGFS